MVREPIDGEKVGEKVGEIVGVIVGIRVLIFPGPLAPVLSTSSWVPRQASAY